MTSTRPPQVDLILRQPILSEVLQLVRREFVTALVRRELDRLRAVSSEQQPDLSAETVAHTVAGRLDELLRPKLRKVINGTGVILNTNLGRAPLSAESIAQVEQIANGYCNLEIDLHTGKRGGRTSRIQELLCLLTGGEGAVVVNNNAAAVVLAVNAFAKDREVVVSRGELIEIGGSFRLPDVIEAAGGILREVGTTNKTRVSDFKKAIAEQTGLLMRCHRSNFAITGFTEETSLGDLAALSEKTGIPLLEDLGSGALFDVAAAGLGNEPMVAQVVASGCTMVSFSADKVLGGPQAGIIIGKKAAIERLSSHPLYRALRLDKLTLALLENTLQSYLLNRVETKLPVLQMICTPVTDIEARARNFANTMDGAINNLKITVVKTEATTGGGALPGELLASFGIVVRCDGMKPNQLVDKLRRCDPPVIAVIKEDDVIIDFRTILVGDERYLERALKTQFD